MNWGERSKKVSRYPVIGRRVKTFVYIDKFLSVFKGVVWKLLVMGTIF